MSNRIENSARLIAVMLLSLAFAGCEGRNAAEGEREQKIALSEVPAPVKTTIEQEAKSGSVREIEKTTENGKTVYAATIAVNGQEQETLIAEDGQVIRRQAVKEKDDDD